MARSIRQHLGQIDQDSGRRAPDVAALEGQHEIAAVVRADLALDPLMVAPVENEGQRHLERLGDLERVDRDRHRRIDDADDRRDLEASAGYVSVEPPDDADPVARQPDFFFGLAQRSGDVVGIYILYAAARKRDLS